MVLAQCPGPGEDGSLDSHLSKRMEGREGGAALGGRGRRKCETAFWSGGGEGCWMDGLADRHRKHSVTCAGHVASW